MKKEGKHTDHKPTKGERLHWASLKEGGEVKLTAAMIKGRPVTEKEIRNRQARLASGKISLLVP